MSRDNHLRSRSRSISRYRNTHYNNASKSNRSPPPDDFNRLSPPANKSRSRYQRERSRSMERNGRSSKRQASPNRVAVTDIRRKNLEPSRVLGVFNLHVRTTESEIRDEFERFGKIEEIIMVKDSKTRGFRGYCFIYFKHEREATAALNHCNGMMLKERMIRVDYSLSARPHSPTPGTYQGKRGRGSDSGRYRDNYRRRSRSRSMEQRVRRRTPPRGDDYREFRSERQERRRRSPSRERERDRGDRHKYR